MNNTSTASGLFSDSAGAALARLAIYTLFFLALAESLPSLIEGRGASIIRENGPIEWIQFSALAIVAAGPGDEDGGTGNHRRQNHNADCFSGYSH